MRKGSIKSKLKKELRCLFKSMDFISKNFLYKKSIDKAALRIYFNIYQQLGMAWEFLGLQCRHWDGYKKVKGKEKACKICGQVKGGRNFYYLIPKTGTKKIGKERYGGFAWEIKRENLRKFPVLFDFDENHRLLGVSILR